MVNGKGITEKERPVVVDDIEQRRESRKEKEFSVMARIGGENELAMLLCLKHTQRGRECLPDLGTGGEPPTQFALRDIKRDFYS